MSACKHTRFNTTPPGLPETGTPSLLVDMMDVDKVVFLLCLTRVRVGSIALRYLQHVIFGVN